MQSLRSRSIISKTECPSLHRPNMKINFYDWILRCITRTGDWCIDWTGLDCLWETGQRSCETLHRSYHHVSMINSLHERQFYPTRLSDTYSDFWLLTRRCVSKGRCSERQHYHVCWIDHAESTCLSHFSLQNPVHSCSYDGLFSKCSATQNMWWYREPYKLLEVGDQYMMMIM